MPPSRRAGSSVDDVVVFSPDTTTSYVVLSDTLDPAEVSLAGAREVPGFATIAGVAGRLLVSSFPSPVVTGYSISNDLRLEAEQQLSFADYGTDDVGFAAQFFASEERAYLTYDVTKRVVWDPTRLEIVEAREQSELSRPVMDGLGLAAAYNRTAWIPRMPTVLKPFYYRDDDGFEYADRTQIAIYDPETHEEQRIVEAPCSGLENATQDEEGYTYFSTWNVSPTRFLYGLAPEPCFVRFTPSGQLDKAWLPQIREWTGGRVPGVMRYLADGKAIASVLHHEEIDVDWDGEYDNAASEAVDGGSHFHLWLLDFEAQTAQQLPEVESMDMAFHGKTIDDRHFVFLPYDDYTRTRVYEIKVDGAVREHLDTSGWVYDWVRLR